MHTLAVSAVDLAGVWPELVHRTLGGRIDLTRIIHPTKDGPALLLTGDPLVGSAALDVLRCQAKEITGNETLRVYVRPDGASTWDKIGGGIPLALIGRDEEICLNPDVFGVHRSELKPPERQALALEGDSLMED